MKITFKYAPSEFEQPDDLRWLQLLENRLNAFRAEIVIGADTETDIKIEAVASDDRVQITRLLNDLMEEITSEIEFNETPTLARMIIWEYYEELQPYLRTQDEIMRIWLEI